MRQCITCLNWFEATPEFFYRDKKRPSGLFSECKQCANLRTKKYKEKNPENIKKINKRTYDKNRDKYLEQKKIYEKENKERIYEYKKKYEEENKEKLYLWRKEYRERNKGKIDKYLKEYRQTEKFRELDKMYRGKRRALKRQLESSFTPKQWRECLEFFKYQCAYCGEESKKLTQDHFIPVKNNGEYTINNIVPACSSCNCSKQDKDFFEWYPISGKYNKSREKLILKYLNYKDNTQQLSIL